MRRRLSKNDTEFYRMCDDCDTQIINRDVDKILDAYILEQEKTLQELMKEVEESDIACIKLSDKRRKNIDKFNDNETENNVFEADSRQKMAEVRDELERVNTERADLDQKLADYDIKFRDSAMKLEEEKGNNTFMQFEFVKTENTVISKITELDKLNTELEQIRLESHRLATMAAAAEAEVLAEARAEAHRQKQQQQPLTRTITKKEVYYVRSETSPEKMEEMKDEIKGDIKKDLRKEMKDEISQEIKGDIMKELLSEIHLENRKETKKDNIIESHLRSIKEQEVVTNGEITRDGRYSNGQDTTGDESHSDIKIEVTRSSLIIKDVNDIRTIREDSNEPINSSTRKHSAEKPTPNIENKACCSGCTIF